MDNPAGFVTHDTVAAVANCVTAIAAIGALCVAALGLSTWKKQLRGNAEWEAARRLLRATYKVQGALTWLRVPLVYEGEGSSVAKGDPGDSSNGRDPVFEERWAAVSQAMTDLSGEQTDAVVIWGNRTLDATEPLRKCYWELGSSLPIFIRHRGDRMFWQAEPDLMKKVASTVLRRGDQDDFDRAVTAAVAKVEAFAGPFLGKGR